MVYYPYLLFIFKDLHGPKRAYENAHAHIYAPSRWRTQLALGWAFWLGRWHDLWWPERRCLASDLCVRRSFGDLGNRYPQSEL